MHLQIIAMSDWTSKFTTVYSEILYIIENLTSRATSLLIGQHGVFTSMTMLTFGAKYCAFDVLKINIH